MCKVEDGRAERQFHTGLPANRLDQDALQIRAMNYQVWAAPAVLGVAERHSRKFDIIRTSQYENCIWRRGKPQHLTKHAKLR